MCTLLIFVNMIITAGTEACDDNQGVIIFHETICMGKIRNPKMLRPMFLNDKPCKRIEKTHTKATINKKWVYGFGNRDKAHQGRSEVCCGEKLHGGA